MIKIFSFFMVLCATSLFSGLSLYNDSPFPLKVKVIGANGSRIGEQDIGPQGHFYMEDQMGVSDPVGEQDSNFRNYSDSVTPYQVFWYCLEGSLYSSCLDASAGATVTANTCAGTYGCKLK